MNKILLATGALLLALPALGAVTVPYSSDIGASNGFDTGWSIVNNGNRRAQSFTVDRSSDFTTPGTSFGICHQYDSEYAANCWAISPAITLEAGTTYTVSVWTKTRGADSEKFEVMTAAGDTPEAFTNGGTTLLRNEFYKHPDDFEKQELTFTPTAAGDYHFAIHCFSDANSFEFGVTGFSVTSGNGGDTPVDPDAPLDLPYSCNFTSQDAFDAWTSIAGPNAVVSNPWTINLNSGFANFDFSEGHAEDNWFLSPALTFPEAGEYVFEANATIYGSLDFVLVSDKENLATAQVLSEQHDLSVFDQPYTCSIDIATPGTYYVGVHLVAESGSYMGYRLHSVKVRSDKAVPALVADLKAAPRGDQLSVDLIWTNPSLDHRGNALTAVSRVDVIRNGEVIKSFGNAAPGAAMSYNDTPAAAGAYAYQVAVYNANGSFDGDPMTANAGYVGHPTATLPYALNVSNAEAAMTDMMTILDGNDDGNTWQLIKETSYYGVPDGYYRSKMVDGSEADEYLATPYFTLQPGYYKVDIDISARFNSYEVGVATDRHDLPGTFVAAARIEDEQDFSYCDRTFYISVDEAGEYVFAIHHDGLPSASYYPDITLRTIDIAAQPVIPGHVTSLAAAENNGTVVLSWVNPSVDFAGNDLPAGSTLGYTVTRDSEVIATVQPSADCTPGSAASFTDTAASADSHVYTVTALNENGNALGDAPKTAIFTGTAVEAPYTTDLFSEWLTINTGYGYYSWEYDANENAMKWFSYYGPEDDCAFAPYVNLRPEMKYTATFTMLNGTSADFDFTVATARGLDLAVVDKVAEGTLAPNEEADRIFTFTTAATAAQDDAENDENAAIAIEPGKTLIGIIPGSQGTLWVKGYHIVGEAITGIETVAAAAEGIAYSDGYARFAPGATDIVIADMAGRVIYRADADAEPVRIDAEGIVVINARIDGRLRTLKIRR